MLLQRSDKCKLYLDRNRIYFIEFDMEKINTCKKIYDLLKNDIEKKINQLYRNIPKEYNFNFVMIFSKLNSRYDNKTLIEIKIDRSFKFTELMQTYQYSLYYLPEIKYDIKKNLYKEKYKGALNKKEEIINSINNTELEKYLSNEGIYYFDKTAIQFLYGKGYVDEQKIIINVKKLNIEIIINQIKKDEYFDNKLPLSLQVFQTKCPNYILEIRQNNTTHILGLYKPKSFLIWKNAITLARIKNKSRRIDSQLNKDIDQSNYILFTNCHLIPSKCFVINQILENPEKRQIFLEQFEDKKISDITSNIYNYKINIKNKDYIGALACLKQISFYTDFDNIENELEKKIEMEKYKNIFTKERIERYKILVKKVNDVFTNAVKKGEDIKNILEGFLDQDLFDNLYYQIYEIYILPFFQKLKETLKKEYNHDKKPKIIIKLHLLLPKYTMNYFNMNDINNFNCLCCNDTSNMDNNNIPNNSNDELNGDNNKNL